MSQPLPRGCSLPGELSRGVRKTITWLELEVDQTLTGGGLVDHRHRPPSGGLEVSAGQSH